MVDGRRIQRNQDVENGDGQFVGILLQFILSLRKGLVAFFIQQLFNLRQFECQDLQVLAVVCREFHFFVLIGLIDDCPPLDDLGSIVHIVDFFDVGSEKLSGLLLPIARNVYFRTHWFQI